MIILYFFIIIALAFIIQWSAIAAAAGILKTNAEAKQVLRLTIIWCALSFASLVLKLVSQAVPVEVLLVPASLLLMFFTAKAVLRLNFARAAGFWLLSFMLGTAFAIVAALSVRAVIVQPFLVPAGSMEPALIKGDRILVNKLACMHPSQRWDIVAFRYPGDRSRLFLKRIVGLPGETIELRGGKVFINGAESQRPPFLTATRWLNDGEYGQPSQQVRIPKDSYYVLGDHSDTSHDSRFWGFVTKKDLIGKAFYIFAPQERIGQVK